MSLEGLVKCGEILVRDLANVCATASDFFGSIGRLVS